EEHILRCLNLLLEDCSCIQGKTRAIASLAGLGWKFLFTIFYRCIPVKVALPQAPSGKRRPIPAKAHMPETCSFYSPAGCVGPGQATLYNRFSPRALFGKLDSEK
ncbi:MAG: hypothetical protein DRI39_09270, partial [Chloroflexi bacterium]